MYSVAIFSRYHKLANNVNVISFFKNQFLLQNCVYETYQKNVIASRSKSRRIPKRSHGGQSVNIVITY